MPIRVRPFAGAEGAPRSVNLQEFINARAFEIDAMEKALTQST